MQLELKNGTVIGDDRPVFIVAEIGLCHNGSEEQAMEMIRRSAEAGVDAVKFQKRDVPNLTTRELLDAPDERFPTLGRTYREIREAVEFDLDTYERLKSLAESLGLLFFASVFDEKSAHEMAELDLHLLKIASHVLTRKPLIEKLCDLGIPTLASTGMAYLDEIDETTAAFRAVGLLHGLFHCVSIYPHAADRANLRMIRYMQERYQVPVGYSCHEIANTSSLLSIAAGACMLERHVTLDRSADGFDHKFALDMPGLAEFVSQVREAEAAMGSIEKTVSEEEWVTRKKYHCSVVSRCAIPEGTVIDRQLLTVKNPGTGIPARRIDDVVGQRARIDIPEDVLLDNEMLEPGI
ncbi:N-acetylneuraminate synthase family protein [Solemya velesiana gill symbiont]|uniref:AFP-like domain-containing protein n=1 Tax=Solemya velesiana gill symbiont TaxID=1918948 RepID=A0A1T2KUG8_9GAMM|nr:N-acetylneuraminate synthase family protein [Solemya velesiana gill symbiont]OOZ36441.1 hypothetical protein BOW51_07155 [Solemya velesiana gill symbiont]